MRGRKSKRENRSGKTGAGKSEWKNGTAELEWKNGVGKLGMEQSVRDWKTR